MGFIEKCTSMVVSFFCAILLVSNADASSSFQDTIPSEERLQHSNENDSLEGRKRKYSLLQMSVIYSGSGLATLGEEIPPGMALSYFWGRELDSNILLEYGSTLSYRRQRRFWELNPWPNPPESYIAEFQLFDIDASVRAVFEIFKQKDFTFSVGMGFGVQIGITQISRYKAYALGQKTMDDVMVSDYGEGLFFERSTDSYFSIELRAQYSDVLLSLQFYNGMNNWNVLSCGIGYRIPW